MPLTEKQKQELNEIAQRVEEAESSILHMTEQTGGQAALAKLATGKQKPDYGTFTDEELRSIFDGAVRAPSLNNLPDGFDPETNKIVGPPHPHCPLAISERGVKTSDLTREEMIESIDALLEHNGYDMDPQRIATAQSMMINSQAAELEGRVDRCTQSLMKLGEGIEGFDDEPEVQLLKQRIQEADNNATKFSRFSEEKCNEYVHQGLNQKFRQLAKEGGSNGVQVSEAIETAKKGLDPTNMSGSTRHLRKIDPELLKLNLMMNLEGLDLSHSNLTKNVEIDPEIARKAKLEQQTRLNEYTRGKLKEVLTGNSSVGRSVFRDINNDPNLTPEERHKVCCTIGKHATQAECRKAMASNPETLMRSDSGATGFITAYLNVHGKSYFDAVQEKSARAILSKEDEGEIAKDIVSAYSSELPSLSAEAAEFLKVSIDVVKEEMPEHAKKLSSVVLANNLALRGGGTAVMNWLRVTDPKNLAAVTAQSKAIVSIDKLTTPRIRPALEKVGGRENAIEQLGKDVENAPGRIEKRVLEKKLEDAQAQLKEAQKELAAIEKEMEEPIRKQELENTENLMPHEERLRHLKVGSEANVGVQALANQIEGHVERNEIGQQLQEDEGVVTSFKETLEQIGDGTVKGREVGELDLPEVDLDELQLGIQEDIQKKQEVEVEQTPTEVIKEPSAEEIENLMKEKAGPELEKLAKLEKKLDLLLGNVKGEHYSPTALEKIKAVFTKGGMNTVLQKTEDHLIAEIDLVKMQIHQKIDLQDFQKLQEQNKKTITDLINPEIARTERNAEYYMAAQKEIESIELQFQMSERLGTSGIYIKMSPEARDELLVMREEALGVQRIYSKDFEVYMKNQADKYSLHKDVSVREKLESGRLATEKKLAPKQEQTKKVSAPKMV